MNATLLVIGERLATNLPCLWEGSSFASSLIVTLVSS